MQHVAGSEMFSDKIVMEVMVTANDTNFDDTNYFVIAII